MKTFELPLPAHDSSPEHAREFMRMIAERWHLDRDVGSTAELCATELVSNVVHHVGEPMTLRACCEDRSLRVEVDDPSPSAPVLRELDRDAETGRGLVLVAALAHEWGITWHQGDGKSVWFELGQTR